MNVNKKEEELKDVIVLAGQILVESGADSFHIENAMNVIAYHRSMKFPVRLLVAILGFRMHSVN